MTLEQGAPWGEPGALPPDGVTVAGDAELRAVVEAARRAGTAVPVVGLTGGDLCRTLGGPRPPEVLRSAEATTFPVDVGSVLVDGVHHWFVAHLVARRSWWFGRVLAVMNAQFVGDWDVAPRGHPGDGRLEVVDANLPLGDRWKARRRLATGTHVPHPRIRVQSVRAWQTDLDPALDVWLDGERLGRARRLSVRVEPGAITVVV